ncbi:MAG: hypothetical protein V1748_07975 [Actinomycetota bacterium]
MSVELVLIPVAIAVGVLAKRAMEKRRDSLHYYQTVMKDAGLLAQALEGAGLEVEVDGDVITTRLAGCVATFSRDEDGIYCVELAGQVESDAALEAVKHLEQLYAGVLQRQVYLKLKERAGRRGYILESEEIEPDRTILLTFEVPEGAR